MKLYFFGTSRREKREEVGMGLIAFAIPDIGFVFRSAHRGTALECEYQAFLTLCQFVEANAGLFKGQKLEFLGDATTVIYEVGRPSPLASPAGQARMAFSDERSRLAGTVRPFRERAAAFKKKLGFSVFWIPVGENRAAVLATFHPTVKHSSLSEKLDTSFLEAFHRKKNSDPGVSSF